MNVSMKAMSELDGLLSEVDASRPDCPLRRVSTHFLVRTSELLLQTIYDSGLGGNQVIDCLGRAE